MDDATLIGRAAPAAFLRRLAGLFERAVRCLFACDPTGELINRHLPLLDALLAVQLQAERARLRPLAEVDALYKALAKLRVRLLLRVCVSACRRVCVSALTRARSTRWAR